MIWTFDGQGEWWATGNGTDYVIVVCDDGEFEVNGAGRRKIPTFATLKLAKAFCEELEVKREEEAKA